ncbi:MAG: sigma factor [Thermoactinomyces sp.]
MDEAEIIPQILDVQKNHSLKTKDHLLYELKGKAFEITKKHCLKYGRTPTKEEYAVALDGLNEAIDRFNIEKNTSFEAFAKRVITFRLIDFFRREKENRNTIAFDNEKITFLSDYKLAAEYQNQQLLKDLTEGRREEITRFIRIMETLGYTWVDIMENRPRHQDSIASLRKLALYLVNLGLGERFLQENPCSRKLKKMIGKKVQRRTLTRYRPYLCALIIVSIYDFPLLRDYLDFFRKEVKQSE